LVNYHHHCANPVVSMVQEFSKKNYIIKQI